MDDAVEYVDDAISGKVPLGQRPAGARLLADMRAKKFSEVVVCKLDRLGRLLRGILDAYDALHDLEVSFRDTHWT
jgi:site-specific DNA recombinase